MNRMLVSCTVLSASALTLCYTAQAQTAEDLVAKNIEAAGGMAAIKADMSLRAEGQVGDAGNRHNGRVRSETENLIRQTSTIEGMTQVQAHDGSSRAGRSIPSRGVEIPR